MPDPTASLRRTIYVLLILITGAIAAGRILSVQRVYEPALFGPADNPGKLWPWPEKPPRAMPTFGSNDRARWATVRALVDGPGFDASSRYAIGKRTHKSDKTYEDSGIFMDDGWGGIDRVLHPERQEFYSSKPPLLPTVLAGEYWLLKQLLGWDIQTHRWEVIRTILLTVNWLPLVICLWLLSRLVERFGVTDWGRIVMMAAACFGTFLTTFIVTLNNHNIAAFGVMFALYPCVELLLASGGRQPPVVSAVVTTENDLGKQGADAPRSPWRFALAGFFAAWTACNELPATSFAVGLFLMLLIKSPLRTILFFVPAALVPVVGFFLTNYLAIGTIWPAYEKFGTEWYIYPGGYWGNRVGIDAAAEPIWLYAIHLSIGHHGIFSLSPIFLFCWFWPRVHTNRGNEDRFLSILRCTTLAITCVVFCFYLFKSNNYGGWTSAARWFFWLIPLWFLAMIPTMDWLAQRRWGRVLAYFLLTWSVFSAAYPQYNPWRHPWLYNLLDYSCGIGY